MRSSSNADEASGQQKHRWIWTSSGVFALVFLASAFASSSRQLFTSQSGHAPAVVMKTSQHGFNPVSRTASVQFGGLQSEATATAEVEPSSSFPQVALTASWTLLLTGAFVGLLRALIAPRPEALALLPMTGVTVQTEEVDDGMSEIFTFENLRSAPGSRPRKHRKGRGHAAGQGETCGFGSKGQKARKGRSVRPGFEGGQNQLWRRTPKLRGRPLGPGHKRIEYQMVSLLKLADAAPGSTLQFDDLSGAKPVLFKIGGLKANQTVSVPAKLTVKAHGFTVTARAAIEAAGGKCVKIDKYSRELDEDGKVKGKEEKAVAMVAFTSQVAYYNEERPFVECDPDWVDVEEEDTAETAGETGQEIAMFAATATPARRVKVGMYKEPAPRSSKMSDKKKAIIDQVNQSLRSSFVVFGFSTKGYTHAQLTKIRRTMPAGVKVQVVKNTLFRMASRGTGFEVLDPLTTDSKAWVFVPESSFQEAVKTMSTYLKETKKQETNPVVGGALPNSLLTEQQVMGLSEMPSKKDLIAKVARLIKAVPTKVATVINATPKKLAVAIRLATTEKVDQGSAPA